MKPAPLGPGLQITHDNPHFVRVRAWVVEAMTRRVFQIYPGRATDGKPARLQGLAIGLVIEGLRVEEHQLVLSKRVEAIEGVSLGLGGCRRGYRWKSSSLKR